MAKTVLFGLLAPYADWEAAYLASALNMLAPGAFAVRTVSVSREPVASIGGFQVMPDFDAASVPDDYAALALIGGMGWRGEAARGFLPLAEDCFRQGKVLGGIWARHCLWQSRPCATAISSPQMARRLWNLPAKCCWRWRPRRRKKFAAGTIFTSWAFIPRPCRRCKKEAVPCPQ